MKKLFLLVTICITAQNSVNAMSEYPLHDAVKRGDEAQVAALITSGADVNRKNTYKAPLHIAAEVGHMGIIRLLLGHGANIIQKSCFGSTPLHIAIENNRDPVVVQLLLDHGALINAQDHGGYTPLHVAVYRSNPTTVKLLLDRGADVNLQEERHGFTALQLGEANLPMPLIRHPVRYPESVQLLKNHVISIRDERYTLLKSNIYQALKGFTGSKAELRTMIETKAQTFGKERANPCDMAPAWEKAYIAYVFHQITQGNMNLDEILSIGKEVESTHDWNGMHLPFKVRAWNDKPLLPYFDIRMYGKPNTIEEDWITICAAFDSMDYEK